MSVNTLESKPRSRLGERSGLAGRLAVARRQLVEVKEERGAAVLAASRGAPNDKPLEQSVQDHEAAVSYLSPRSYACLERSGDPAKKGLVPDQARKALHDGLQKAIAAIGRPRKLEEAIRPVVSHHELLKPVSHSQENAFSLVSVPDGIAQAELCGTSTSGAHPAVQNDAYGHYYGAAFQLKVSGQGEEPAALNTLWGLEDGRWRVIAWEVMGD